MTANDIVQALRQRGYNADDYDSGKITIVRDNRANNLVYSVNEIAKLLEEDIKDRTTKIEANVICNICNKAYKLMVYRKDFTAWRNGAFIQDVMPYLTAAERELFVSHTCGACFDKMFRNGETNEE